MPCLNASSKGKTSKRKSHPEGGWRCGGWFVLYCQLEKAELPFLFPGNGILRGFAAEPLGKERQLAAKTRVRMRGAPAPDVLRLDFTAVRENPKASRSDPLCTSEFARSRDYRIALICTEDTTEPNRVFDGT